MEERVLRRFVDGAGKIMTIPAKHTVRQDLLRWLVEDFEPDQRYPEKEVNEILLRRHDDCAALRRYLVVAGLLAREGGVYWRADPD